MTPFHILFAVFLLVPLLEIYLLIKVGGIIGGGWTVALVVGTAAVGAWLVRAQGLSTVQRVQSTLQQGGFPAVEMLEGLAIFLAGALLLTPGFFTDAIGFACLLPPLRRSLVVRALRSGLGSPPGGAATPPQSAAAAGRKPLDGEYRRLDD